MNTIFIHDLRLETKVGVYAWERELPQTIRIDLDIGLPSSRPFETGDLADAIDYAAVVARLRGFAGEHPHALLERFAEAMAALVLDEFGAQSVKLRVAKLGALPGVREIGVAIERDAGTRGRRYEAWAMAKMRTQPANHHRRNAPWTTRHSI
jgi:7,8-dihydroneopterin aldolase/epimerase/oxygenase